MQLKINVLLVEDDDDLRDSVVEWLELNGMHITAVRNAAEFYQALPKCDFQIAVIDVGLPDQEGYVLAEYVRANTNMGVVILTARSAIEDRLKGYKSGADQYLVKPVDCRELSAVIVSIARRVQNTAVDVPDIPERWTIFVTQWELHFSHDVQVALSLKELMFLELLASKPGLPVQKKTILTKLYQRDDYHSGRSLDSLVRRLRAKIVSRTGVDIPIRTVHSVGYCFAGEIALAEGDSLQCSVVPA
ncbi:DNA-binding response regulator [Janthinobacterium sp. BJB1]|uniref:response regulator transcription factor n=1 Tax=Janthinobacterium sp. GW458P TaxID=1981504 RepID=UPI000A322943|nr:response regulator transcription factor [Janthinobacterium sp. GW458P]MBE3024356.1 response regulator transcription factor [Janthinobacterium sp. GW458P]PHV15139.1 DNA-binding response regulator [Janthinobacterium sp. BJB303]PJC98182.1 DNA-binding response regulator [Janthinobacterium sp. BJB1]